METKRLSFDMSEQDHTYLKMCCARLGVSIKDFIIKATNEKVVACEDIWLWQQVDENQEGDNHILIDNEGNFRAI